MLNESPSGLNRVVTSLKVAALLTVLGAVVLAAEQRIGPDISSGTPVARRRRHPSPHRIAVHSQRLPIISRRSFPRHPGRLWTSRRRSEAPRCRAGRAAGVQAGRHALQACGHARAAAA